jgi:hypothetical protein
MESRVYTSILAWIMVRISFDKTKNSFRIYIALAPRTSTFTHLFTALYLFRIYVKVTNYCRSRCIHSRLPPLLTNDYLYCRPL